MAVADNTGASEVSEVKAPPIRIHDEALYNQEKIITILEKLLGQQHDMAEIAAQLNETMAASTKATSGLVSQMIKVPIAMAVVGASSWAFLYAKAISENTWLIIMGVAVFPWLGDSISAIAKLIRGRNGEGRTP